MDYDAIEAGDEILALRQEVTVLQTAMYCAVTWDFARQHYDREYARSLGFKDPVIDPQMYGAYLARVLDDWISPQGRLAGLKLQYRRPGYVGDTLIYKGRVARKFEESGARCAECELAVENQSGECLVQGLAVLSFDANPKEGP